MLNSPPLFLFGTFAEVAIVVSGQTIAAATTITNGIRSRMDIKTVVRTTGAEATIAEVEEASERRLLALSNQFAQMIDGKSRTSVIVRNNSAANGRTTEPEWKPHPHREAAQSVEVCKLQI